MYPGNHGLFHRIIPQSGSITCPWACQRDALQNAKRIANLVGCPTDLDTQKLSSCLRTVPDETYMQVMNNPLNKYRRFPLEFVVSIDGEFVPLSTWELLHGESNVAKARRNVFRNFNVMTGLVEDEGFMMITPFVGIDNTDTFSVKRLQLENKHVPEIVRLMFGDNIPGGVNTLVNFEYTHWDDPGDIESSFNSFMRLSSDYTFNIHTIDVTKIHTTNNDKSKTFLYVMNAVPSQHKAWVPSSWKGGSVHGDDLTFIFGFDSEFGFTSFTSPFGVEPEKWEKEMSKEVIKIWTNFAKSGDPNKPERIKIDWPEYNLETQVHLNISRTMSIGHRLFERGYNFWTNVIPGLIKMAKGNTTKQKNYCEKEGGCKP